MQKLLLSSINSIACPPTCGGIDIVIGSKPTTVKRTLVLFSSETVGYFPLTVQQVCLNYPMKNKEQWILDHFLLGYFLNVIALTMAASHLTHQPLLISCKTASFFSHLFASFLNIILKRINSIPKNSEALLNSAGSYLV